MEMICTFHGGPWPRIPHGLRGLRQLLAELGQGGVGQSSAVGQEHSGHRPRSTVRRLNEGSRFVVLLDVDIDERHTRSVQLPLEPRAVTTPHGAEHRAVSYTHLTLP